MTEVVLGAYGITYAWNRSPFASSSRTVLEDVSFEISRGEILALFGPNGSGKSTLMKAVAGILPLSRAGCSGQIRFLGRDFLSVPPYRRAQNVVYVPSDFNPEFPLTVEEAVYLGRICQGHGFLFRPSQEDKNAVEWALEQCLCLGLRDRNLETLSGGERQLVILARALAQGAKILFLDETLSRMDFNHQVSIGRMLKGLSQKGWSILLVSHDINLATEWADRGIFLKSGKKIAQGPIQDLITTEKMQSLYPGSHLIVSKNPATDAPKVFFGRP